MMRQGVGFGNGLAHQRLRCDVEESFVVVEGRRMRMQNMHICGYIYLYSTGYVRTCVYMKVSLVAAVVL